MAGVLLCGIGNSGLTSLRKTRSSELSTFVKNYNKAQSRYMKKEIDIWYKSSRHVLRTTSDNQQRLYHSLLKLSKEKKTIKIQREDDEKRRKMARENLARRKEQLNRRRQLANEDTRGSSRANILVIRHPEHISESRDRQVDANHGNRQANSSPESHDRPDIVQENGKEQPEEFLTKPRDTRNSSPEKRQLDLLQETDGIIPVENQNKHIQRTAKDIAGKDSDKDFIRRQLSDLPPLLPSQRKFSCSANRLTKPKMSLTTLLSDHQGQNDEIRRSHPYHTAALSLPIPEDDSPGYAPPPFAYQEVKRVDSPLTQGDLNNIAKRQSVGKAEKGVRRPPKGTVPPTKKRPKLKKRPDPSDELNEKSSIEAMRGKTYEVSSYRRNSRGSLTEERQTMNTSVDVSRYFNFNYYQNRITRNKLLDESRSIEMKQNKRVRDFIRKLNLDEEEVRVLAETEAKRMEEERLEILKRDAETRNKPPKYGAQREYTITPGYVRKYKKRNKEPGPEKSKSSWYTPSLHTLNITAPVSNLSSFYTNGASSQTNSNLQQTQFVCAAHLVNINLARYSNVDT